MNDITIINGTNRTGNKSQIFSTYYYQILHKMYNTHLIYPNTDILQVQNNINNSNKIIFVIPEYNGSYPGQLKLLIDNCNMNTFKDKHILFTGIAAGLQGNVRGVDHLCDVMLYLKAIPFYDRLYFPSINNLINDNEIIDNKTKTLINNQINNFLKL